MSWPEVVSQGFPPPRDDELAHLRRDITDELADHLDCAMRRELRRTDDETAAERAVLDRFGNPQRLARRLWWNAMKEKVMKDRIMLVAVVLLIAACVVTSEYPGKILTPGGFDEHASQSGGPLDEKCQEQHQVKEALCRAKPSDSNVSVCVHRFPFE